MNATQIECPAPLETMESSGSERAEVLFFLHRDGLDPVVPAAYLTPARRLRSEGGSVRFVAFSRVGEFFRQQTRRAWRTRLDEVEQACDRRATRLPSAPARWPNLWNDAKTLRAWLSARYSPSNPVILHCHGAGSASLALQARQGLKGIKVLVYSLGPHASEFLYSQLGHVPQEVPAELQRRVKTLNEEEGRAFSEADAVICLSRRMIEYGRERYALSEQRTVFIPFFLETRKHAEANLKRSQIREQLGLGQRFVLVYCGSLHKWQRVREVLHVFSLIKQLQADAHLLMLTSNPARASKLVVSSGLPQDALTSLKVPFESVPAYLGAADFGIVGRGLFEPASVVNDISSPIKCGEYLASGCPMILGSHVGDFSETVSQHRLGVVIADDARESEVLDQLHTAVEAYRQQPEEYRRRCAEYARTELDIELYWPRLQELYQRLERDSCLG